MQKKSEDFSMQEALRLANTPAGQQLLAMLQQTDPQQLQQWKQQASAGDFSQLSDLFSSPEASAFLKELGR